MGNASHQTKVPAAKNRQKRYSRQGLTFGLAAGYFGELFGDSVRIVQTGTALLMRASRNIRCEPNETRLHLDAWTLTPYSPATLAIEAIGTYGAGAKAILDSAAPFNDVPSVLPKRPALPPVLPAGNPADGRMASAFASRGPSPRASNLSVIAPS